MAQKTGKVIASTILVIVGLFGLLIGDISIILMAILTLIAFK